MKFPILTLLLLFAFSCDKNNPDDPTCISGDPLEEISWLKEVKENMSKRANPTGGQIIQYTYQGECVFMIDNCFGCADNLLAVYDAEQNLLCEFGGIIGLNTCPDFDKEATNRKVIYDGTE